ncbi:MAG TPA: hypothetical protein GX521_01745 [Firmicutes bacterium]|nr:hypothetical protein [Bacillota bacterium]
MGKKCPFCNQLVIEEDRQDSFNDPAPCAACEMERLQHKQGKPERNEKG